jgi:hypothetical protein
MYKDKESISAEEKITDKNSCNDPCRIG